MTSKQPYEATYTDELLADGTVYRRYSDGRQEWRSRNPGGEIQWHDDRGRSGTDVALGRKIVKRTHADGVVIYGRENGFGRTVWSDGVLTVNKSRFGGRLGAAITGVAGAALIGALVYPPDALTPDQEADLLANSATPGGGSGGDGSRGDSYSDWGGDGDDGGDFG
ncbi:hypothetical protein L5I01_24375 [Gordonia sp. HY442]|uniref:hypothetical protein n=1 Tax=Gordonia zhenghanii TaxID=2911516 RepID=UPI001F2153A6|nr:hypothetical protein [Gordonia zhenghanii]MCF8606494.1 hypothetical protein [Gordonia zhenghanii]